MENEEKYLKDLKELKPLPLESAGSRQSAVRSPKSAIGSQERESRERDTKAAVIIKDNQSGIIEMKEVIVVESLKNSKNFVGLRYSCGNIYSSAGAVSAEYFRIISS